MANKYGVLSPLGLVDNTVSICCKQWCVFIRVPKG